MSEPPHPELWGYAICTTERSGSTLLCRLLASTGLLGRPDEYFRTLDMRGAGFEDYPEDPEAQLAEITRRGATHNGVYGLKIMPWQADLAKATRWAARLPNLLLVDLVRHDVLGQAISWARAKQTDQWEAAMEALAEPVFDGAAIAEALEILLGGRRRWDRWYAVNGLTPLRLTYEDVVARPQANVDLIAEFAGAYPAAAIAPELVDVAIQRDELTAAWRARFIAERGDLGRFDI